MGLRAPPWGPENRVCVLGTQLANKLDPYSVRQWPPNAPAPPPMRFGVVVSVLVVLACGPSVAHAVSCAESTQDQNCMVAVVTAGVATCEPPACNEICDGYVPVSNNAPPCSPPPPPGPPPPPPEPPSTPKSDDDGVGAWVWVVVAVVVLGVALGTGLLLARRLNAMEEFQLPQEVRA